MSNDQIASSMKNGFPEYQGKTIIVTGGAKGIGAQIVEQFAQLGAKVAIVDVDNVGEVLAKKWNKDGFNVKYFHCDVSKGNAVKQMITAIENSFDRIDVLINNAGIFPRADFLEMDEGFWDSVMGVNLKGVYLTSQAVAPLMMKQKKGSIINIGSIHAKKGNKDTLAYAVSKGGLVTLTKNLAEYFAEKRIRVNCIHPGWVASDGELARWDEIKEKKSELDQKIKSIPLGRLQTGTDIAHTAVFLASDFADQITGQMLTVDGGLSNGNI